MAIELFASKQMFMNKKIFLTALILGSAVTYCILKLASTKDLPKMNAKPEKWL